MIFFTIFIWVKFFERETPERQWHWLFRFCKRILSSKRETPNDANWKGDKELKNSIESDSKYAKARLEIDKKDIRIPQEFACGDSENDYSRSVDEGFERTSVQRMKIEKLMILTKETQSIPVLSVNYSKKNSKVNRNSKVIKSRLFLHEKRNCILHSKSLETIPEGLYSKDSLADSQLL